jgi:SAM-dependent methyltransferase
MINQFNICTFSSSAQHNRPVYNELAMNVFYGLQALGYDVVMRSDYLHEKRINIVFGLNHYSPRRHPSLYERKIVAFNLETLNPLDTQNAGLSAEYLNLLRLFPVLDFSTSNVALLTEKNVMARLHPMTYAPETERILAPDAGSKPLQDVLFYGSLDGSPRRAKLVNDLQAAGLSVKVLTDCFGGERDAHIAQSKLVLNVSATDDALLEHSRLNYLLSNGVPVVSEISARADADIDSDLRKALQPVAYDQLVARCLELVKNKPLRAALAKGCIQYMRAPERASSAAMKQVLAWVQHCTGWAASNPAPSEQTLAARSEYAYWKAPSTLNIGSGREYNPAWVNADISMQWEPDWLVDLAKPIDFDNRDVIFGAHGIQRLERGMFETIKASEVLEHVSDATVFMENCLNLLCDGGVLNVTVPYDLSYGAWQDPTHVRAFNERSFWYYCHWHWYLGWMTHRFDTVELLYSLSEYGHEINNKGGMKLEQIAAIPRAVDHIMVKLVKRPLSAEEIAHGRSLQLCQR